MEDQQIDSFLAYVSLVEESSEQFSQDQVKKLELIRTKVGEILKKTQPPAQVSNSSLSNVPAQSMEPARIIESFDAFVEVNERIKKKGSKWVVTDKSGKKVLGTHPSKAKAISQLQAIEINKHQG